MAKIGDKNDGMHNEYGYSDPTASTALKNLSQKPDAGKIRTSGFFMRQLRSKRTT